MTRTPTAKIAQATVDAWNRAVPIGTPVTLIDDFGEAQETTTRSQAWLTGAGRPIVAVEGAPAAMRSSGSCHTVPSSALDARVPDLRRPERLPAMPDALDAAGNMRPGQLERVLEAYAAAHVDRELVI